MFTNQSIRIAALLVSLLIISGCGKSLLPFADKQDGGSDLDIDVDTDIDADTDIDGDADIDADTDIDGDADIDADTDNDADIDGDTDNDVDIDSDVDSDVDIDGDSDSDSDSDTDPGDDSCIPNESISFKRNESSSHFIDIWSENDSLTQSCEGNWTTGLERIIEVTLEDSGDLVILPEDNMMPENLLVVSLFPVPTEYGACPEPSDEIDCQIAYPHWEMGFETIPIFYDLAPGSYLLAVTNTGELLKKPIKITIGLHQEDCDNKIDDNFDGNTDCADISCLGTPECTGGSCPVDTFLGELVPKESYDVFADTRSSGNDVTLSCNWNSWANDHIIEFSINQTSNIVVAAYVDYWISYAVGLLFEGGVGNDCSDNEHSCMEMWQDGKFMTVNSSPLPPGTYYLALEGMDEFDGGDIAIAAKPVCQPYQVWDSVSEECVPWSCDMVIDLGTFAGIPIVEEGNTCLGTDIFGSYDMECGGSPSVGHELMYQLTLEGGQNISVMLVPRGIGLKNSKVYILTDCEDFNRETCAAFSTGMGSVSTLEYTNDTDSLQTIFIVTDARLWEDPWNTEENCGEISLVIN